MIRTFLLLIFVFTVSLSCKQAKKSPESNQDSKYKEPIILKGMRHGLIMPPVNIVSSENDTIGYSIYLAGEAREGEAGIKGKIMDLNFGPETPVLIDNKEIRFKLIHFHTPSYHLVEGEEFAMEFHVITEPASRLNNTGEYLVVSTLFRVGEFNQFIDELLQKPLNFGEGAQESQLNILLGGRAMVKKTNDNLDGFYHYVGPLATEPYSNSVHWYIARRIFEISEEQYETIKKLVDQE